MLNPFRRREAPAVRALPDGMRVYAIGDIHGRLDLLEALFAQIGVDNAVRGRAETEILLLGDLIDRGPQSADVVRWAMREDHGFARVSAIRGNHEASLLAVLDGQLEWLESWLSYGGIETLESWGVPARTLREASPDEIAQAARNAVPTAEREWLSALPTMRKLGDYLFVHAGVRPSIAIDQQVEQDLIWIREEFLDSAADHGVVVVHGHTISEQVVHRANRIGIDTGAYRTGKLTALGLQATDRWFLAT